MLSAHRPLNIRSGRGARCEPWCRRAECAANDRDLATLASESGEVTNQTGAGQQDGAAAGVGALVRIRRRAAGLTQQELADLARVSLGTVRDLEQGRTHRPGRGSVTRLAGGKYSEVLWQSVAGAYYSSRGS
jgi:DNA-binding transcriptional regulator YiaG